MDLRLATFNLENLGIREGEQTPENHARLPLHTEALREVVGALDADAVAFQELVDPKLLEPLLQGLNYPHVVLGHRTSSPLLIGVLSRYPLRNAIEIAGSVDLSIIDQKTGMEMVVRGALSRPALFVTWDVPGFETTLIVVHWKSKIPSFTSLRGAASGDLWPSFGAAGEGRLLTEVKRLAQAVEIRKAVDRLLVHDAEARVAVLGDFNDTLESEGLRIVLGDARSCSSPGLTTAELVPCELAVPEHLRFTQVYRGQPELIDHLLITTSLARHFTGAQIPFNDKLRDADASSSTPSIGSDHAPLVATFRF